MTRRVLPIAIALLLVTLPAAATVASELLHADLVLVKKADRKLYLIRNGMPFREYRIALGVVPNGHKIMAGDGRTPEGRYTVDWRNPDSRYHKSLHISYPSRADVEFAAALGVDAGGMIMIHGESDIPILRRVNQAKGDWTEGCIAVRNEAIEEIWQAVADGTPIEILP